MLSQPQMQIKPMRLDILRGLLHANSLPMIETSPMCDVTPIVRAESTRRRILGLLIGAHLVVGLTMAMVAVWNRGIEWPGWTQTLFFGLVGSEMLLVGLWAGFSSATWLLKLPVVAAAVSWFVALALSPNPYWDFDDVLEGIGFLAPTVLVVASVSMQCRRWFVTVERGDCWVQGPAVAELQFTLRSVIRLTVAVSVLLALGRIVQSLDEGKADTVLTILVFSLIAVLSGVMLVWASLGNGRVAVRIPVALLGMAVVGLIFPYYLGGPPDRFLLWPLLTLVISAYTMASLFVIRGCGYRLVLKGQASRIQSDQEAVNA